MLVTRFVALSYYNFHLSYLIGSCYNLIMKIKNILFQYYYFNRNLNFEGINVLMRIMVKWGQL